MSARKNWNLKRYHWEFPYFCLNLIKLDELGKIYNDSVETSQVYFWEHFVNCMSEFELINNLTNTFLAKSIDYSTIHAKFC